jgi:hypothetical protein
MANNADSAQVSIQRQVPSEPSSNHYALYLVAYFDDAGRTKTEEVSGIDHFSVRAKHLIFGGADRYAETCLSAFDGVIDTHSAELRTTLEQHLRLR